MKNKILDNLPTIFVALVFVFGMTLTWNHAKANPREMAQFPWTYQQMPVWCGPLDEVNNLLEVQGYVPVEVAFGKMKALPEGEIVYAVTTYASTVVDHHILRAIETPDQGEKCIIAMLYNYKRLEIEPGEDT